ncbi:MAG: tyrosine-type recombinase/integrase, partial [Planctomycetaceae bacterium]|nr:tyrosine-type recombinase/integrase [Planctomycetaceae bacterium]
MLYSNFRGDFANFCKMACILYNLNPRAAGIEKRDAMDQVIDVHALRHTHATILVDQGVPITVVQQAMRHADIRMTMRYTHTKLENVSDGVSKFPD